MSVVMVPIICACAWTGEVPTVGACPGCGADHTFRVTTVRLKALRAYAAAAAPGARRPEVNPSTRHWLLHPAHRLIAPPARGMDCRPTVDGERVLVAAQLAEHEAGLKRELVAESVARHAQIDEP
jgi:hypothetical protein